MAESASTSTSTSSVPFFKKKSKSSAARSANSNGSHGSNGNGNAEASTSTIVWPASASRKRSASPESSSGVIRGRKKQAFNPLKQGTAGIVRRRLQEGENENALSDDDDSGSIAVKYADRGRQGMGYGLDVESGEARRDANGELVLNGDDAIAKTAGEAALAATQDGLYHGTAKYQAQLPTGSAKYAPIKGPNANIKTITLVDYQPDVCKDYKETGWCGFGDSCKFLHDRGDYLHGWQMDSILSQPSSAPVVAATIEEELPFACIICREPFSPKPPHDPIVTRCGHYFGSSCAIKRYAKNTKCFACGAGTQGIFNKATKILERKEKAQKERIKQREEAEGTTNYDEEEGGGVEIEGLAEG